MRRCRAVTTTAAALLVACGFDGLGSGTPGGPAPADASTERSSLLDGSPSDTSVDAPTDGGSDANEGGLAFPFVYAHTATELYRMEPTTKTFAVVGPLTGCVGMSDIAVDKDGKIVGIGDDLYSIDPSTGACTMLANASVPIKLTFVPAGTLDPVEEALVGYLGNDYYRVNRTTGALTRVTMNPIVPYFPSGDVVYLDGKGMFVTVTGTPFCNDCLLQVSPVDGRTVKELGAIGRLGVYGLGGWAGKLYGFMFDGETREITIGPTSVMSTTVPNPISPMSWVGGGSSTRAPK